MSEEEAASSGGRASQQSGANPGYASHPVSRAGSLLSPTNSPSMSRTTTPTSVSRFRGLTIQVEEQEDKRPSSGGPASRSTSATHLSPEPSFQRPFSSGSARRLESAGGSVRRLDSSSGHISPHSPSLPLMRHKPSTPKLTATMSQSSLLSFFESARDGGALSMSDSETSSDDGFNPANIDSFERHVSFRLATTYELTQEVFHKYSKNHVVTSQNTFTCHMYSGAATQYGAPKLAAGTHDGPIILFSKKTTYATELNTTKLTGHAGVVTCLHYDEGMGLLFSGSGDRTVRVWDMALKPGKQLIQTLVGHRATVTAVTTMFDRLLVTASTDSSLIIWSSEVDGGRQHFLYSFFRVYQTFRDFGGAWVTCMSFGATRNEGEAALFVGDSAGYAHVFKMKGRNSTGIPLFKRTKAFNIHDLGVYFMECIPAENFLLTLSYDGTARVTNTANGRRVTSLVHPRGTRFSAAAFNSSEKEVILGDDKGLVYNWNIYSERKPYSQQLGMGPISFLTVREGVVSEDRCIDGEIVVSAPESVTFWHIYREIKWIEFTGHDGHVVAVVHRPAPPGGHTLDERLISAGVDCTVRLWTPEDMREVEVFDEKISEITSMAFAPKAGVLVTGHDDGFMSFWNIVTGSSVRFNSHENTVTAVTICVAHYRKVDKECVATVSFDGSLRVWMLGMSPSAGVQPQSLLYLPLEGGELLTVAFTRQQEFAVAGNSGRVTLCSLGGSQRQPTGSQHSGAITCSCVHGNILLTGSEDWSLKLWDTVHAFLLATIDHAHDGPVLAMCSLEGSRLAATTGTDGAIKVWDYANAALHAESLRVSQADLEDESVRAAVHHAQGLAKVYYHPSIRFTCLAFNAARSDIVAGNESGALMFFHFPLDATIVGDLDPATPRPRVKKEIIGGLPTPVTPEAAAAVTELEEEYVEPASVRRAMRRQLMVDSSVPHGIGDPPNTPRRSSGQRMVRFAQTGVYNDSLHDVTTASLEGSSGSRGGGGGFVEGAPSPRIALEGTELISPERSSESGASPVAAGAGRGGGGGGGGGPGGETRTVGESVNIQRSGSRGRVVSLRSGTWSGSGSGATEPTTPGPLGRRAFAEPSASKPPSSGSGGVSSVSSGRRKPSMWASKETKGAYVDVGKVHRKQVLSRRAATGFATSYEPKHGAGNYQQVLSESWDGGETLTSSGTMSNSRTIGGSLDDDSAVFSSLRRLPIIGKNANATTTGSSKPVMNSGRLEGSGSGSAIGLFDRGGSGSGFSGSLMRVNDGGGGGGGSGGGGSGAGLVRSSSSVVDPSVAPLLELARLTRQSSVAKMRTTHRSGRPKFVPKLRERDELSD